MTTETMEFSGARRPAQWKAIGLCVAMFVAYFVLLKLISTFAAPLFSAIPAPHGAPALWWRIDKSVALTGVADIAAAIGLVFAYCVVRGRRFADLGFNKPGTALAWVLVLAAQAGLIWFDTHMGAVGQAPGLLSPYALLAAAIVGPCAAFAEETFFRGYLMDELRRGGFGTLWQIVIAGLFFGLAHIGYAAFDWTIMVFTGVLGMFWSLIYVLARRSLWPTIIAHIINDAVLIPSVFYIILTHSGH